MAAAAKVDDAAAKSGTVGPWALRMCHFPASWREPTALEELPGRISWLPEKAKQKSATRSELESPGTILGDQV